jgi:hypothetical protein
VLTVIRHRPIRQGVHLIRVRRSRLGVNPSALAVYTLTSPPAGLYTTKTDSPSSVMPLCIFAVSYHPALWGAPAASSFVWVMLHFYPKPLLRPYTVTFIVFADGLISIAAKWEQPPETRMQNDGSAPVRLKSMAEFATQYRSMSSPVRMPSRKFHTAALLRISCA